MANIKGTKAGTTRITASYGGLTSYQDITVTQLSLSTTGVCTISGLSHVVYDGSVHKLEPVVKVTATGVGTDVTLVKGTDYTVTWTNTGDNASCISTGTVTVTVTGMGNYKDTKSGQYQITPASFTVTAGDQSYPYDGSAHGSAITVSNLKGSQTATIRYRTTSSGDYTLTTAPQRTAAGSQTVYWQVTAPNHQTQEGSYALEITASAPTLTFNPTNTELIYNGSRRSIGTITYTGDGTAYYLAVKSTTQPATPSASATTGTGWVSVSNGGTVYATKSGTASSAGTYWVFVKSSAGTNYSAVNPVYSDNKVINQKTPTFTWTASGTLTYNGSAQVLGTLNYDGDGTPSYAVTTSSTPPSSGWTEMAKNTNVNISSSAATATTYYIHVKATAGTNYSAVSAVNKANKAIGKATATLTFTPVEGTLTYTGSAQNIGTINYTGDGTAKYVVSTSSTKPSDSAISTTVTDGTAINSSSAGAGTYYVYLIATAGTNYNAVSSKQGGSKEIENANITVKTSGQNSVIDQSYVYTGSAQGTGLTATTVASQTATIKYGSAEGSYTSTSVPKRTASGSQTVFYQVTANNHNTVTGSYTLEITNATFTVSANNQSYTYNGNPQGSAISVSNIKGSQTATIRYRTASSGDYTLTSAPQLTDAGSQTVYWQVEIPNHTTQTGSYTLTVGKATPTMSLLGNIATSETDETSPSGIPYHGTAYIEGRASVVGKIYWGNSQSSMTTTANVTTPSSTSYNVSITTRSNVGTTTVYAYFVPTDTINYNSLGSSSSPHASASAVIIQADDSKIVVATSGNLAYTGENQTIATVDSDHGIRVINNVKQFALGYSTTSGGTVTWGDMGSTVLQVKGPGTYYIHSKWTADDNHSHSESDVQESVPVTIGAGTLTVTATGYSGTYNGSQHDIITDISAVNQNNVEVYPTYTYSTDGTNFVSTMPKVTNVVQSGTYYWKATLSGYTTEIGTVTVTISKAANPMTITNPTGTSSSSRYKIYDTSGYRTVQISTSGAQGTVSYLPNTASYVTISDSGLVTYKAAGDTNITVTAAGNANYESGSKTVYVASVVDTIKTYGNVTGTISITQTDDFPAAGVTLTTSNIEDYFEYSSTCEQILTWNSGNTTYGTISYAWSGNNAVISSLGTNAKARASLSIGTFTVTATGQGSKTKTQSVTSGYQEANAVESINLTLGSNSIIFGNSTTATVTGTYTSGASGTITPTSLTAEDDTIVEITS